MAYSTIPKNCILVIENIEYFFPSKIEQTNQKVCTSELLNMLDGLMVNEGVITFMTANNISGIPKNLLRPGRIDKFIEFSYCIKEQVIDIHHLIRPNDNSEELSLGRIK